MHHYDLPYSGNYMHHYDLPFRNSSLLALHSAPCDSHNSGIILSFVSIKQFNNIEVQPLFLNI